MMKTRDVARLVTLPLWALIHSVSLSVNAQGAALTPPAAPAATPPAAPAATPPAAPAATPPAAPAATPPAAPVASEETSSAVERPITSAEREQPAPVAEPAPAAAASADGEANPEQDELVDDALAGGSVLELADKTYYFIGARYRGIILPAFMIDLFADGGKTVYVHGFGPELAIRKNGFEYNLSAWFSLYGMDDTLLKGKDDTAQGYEFIQSDLNILYFSSDFMWSNEFLPGFALTYGAGVGIGAVFGDLRRNEAYPTGSVTDLSGYRPCTGPNDVNDRQNYCDDGENFGDPEASWSDGGSRPIVFPWLTLQTGLRYKVHRNFVTRLDLGFGTSGFFFGLGADYGL